MVPGDMIEWVYKRDKNRAYKTDQIWSSTMNHFVLIGEPSLLISITNETYSWLNSYGTFSANLKDDTAFSDVNPGAKIVPRKTRN